MNPLETAVLKGLGILSTTGLPDFGRYPKGSDAQLKTMAKTWALGLASDPKITPKLVEQTVLRYVSGTVTVWTPSGMVQPSEFPSLNQFRDACLQTWHDLYIMLSIGESEKCGCLVMHTIVIPRSLTEGQRQAEIIRARKSIGIPEPVPELPMSAEAARKIPLRVRGMDEPKVFEDDRRDVIRSQADRLKQQA